MLDTNDSRDNVQAIINSLISKSKRTMRNARALRKQARCFSPAYRGFINKVINNKSLKITNSENCYLTNIDKDDKIRNRLSKKKKNMIVVDINCVEALPHELGHAVDFWFGFNMPLSYYVILPNGKTLMEIFVEEFNSKVEEIYQLVLNEYKHIINSSINDKAYDILMNNIDKYRELKHTFSDRKKRKKLQKELYESGFCEVYYQSLIKRCYSIIDTKYSPITDALSSKYDLSGLFIQCHSPSYYAFGQDVIVNEFFANAFAAKVTSKHCQFDNLIKLLPQSFNAFEQLFVIAYDHIQNDKRFTDVEIRKVK